MRMDSSGGDSNDEVPSFGAIIDCREGLGGDGPVGHIGICLFGMGLDRRLTVKAEGIGEGGGVEWCSACCWTRTVAMSWAQVDENYGVILSAINWNRLLHRLYVRIE